MCDLVDESAVSLRFWGDSLVPEAVTHALGMQPHLAFARGDSLATGAAPAQLTGMWMYWIERCDETSIENKILQILEQFPQDLNIWNDLNSTLNSGLFSSLWLHQLEHEQKLTADTLLKLGQRGLTLHSQICFEDLGE